MAVIATDCQFEDSARAEMLAGAEACKRDYLLTAAPRRASNTAQRGKVPR